MAIFIAHARQRQGCLHGTVKCVTFSFPHAKHASGRTSSSISSSSEEEDDSSSDSSSEEDSGSGVGEWSRFLDIVSMSGIVEVV